MMSGGPEAPGMEGWKDGHEEAVARDGGLEEVDERIIVDCVVPIR